MDIVDMIVHVDETISAERMHELEDVVRTDACVISACTSHEKFPSAAGDLQSRVHDFRQRPAHGSSAGCSCGSGRTLDLLQSALLQRQDRSDRRHRSLLTAGFSSSGWSSRIPAGGWRNPLGEKQLNFLPGFFRESGTHNGAMNCRVLLHPSGTPRADR